MKPIILEMKEMSDSTEVYESRPNPVFTYFIYVLLALLLISFGWMYFSKMDIVIKSNGMFRSEEAAVDVSSGASGEVAECHIVEGQYVQAGDVLFSIQAEGLEGNISDTKELLADVSGRIKILKAYSSYLNGDSTALENCIENTYYSEFLDRKNLLELNAKNLDTDINAQESQFQKELEYAGQLVSKYQEQINKLKQVEECIRTRTNIFDASESYYESIISSYLSNYNVTATSYDVQIQGHQEMLSEYQKQMDNCQSQIAQQENPDQVVELEGTKTKLQELMKEAQDSITSLSADKEAALSNLELQQIASLEQQIASIESSLNSAKSSQATLQAQLESVQEANTTSAKEVNRLTEKQMVAAELANYEAKQTEYETILKQYDLESGNAKVTAATSGYIYLNQNLKVGSYITQGTSVCQIFPEENNGYYAEIYVENKDIAKMKEGQEVKFEIAAYPSSEYGYFTGVIDTISKDIKVDQGTGSAYYLVKVKCRDSLVTNKEGKTGSIMNGMACQAKVVVDKQNVLSYLLQKLDLMD